MDNLLGVADQVWLAGFWLNSGLQGEARANGKLDTSSLALHYLHGLPRPVYWVLWLWRRLRGEILFHDKNLLLLHHQGHYQLLLRNTVVYNPWLSSEAAFIQRFSQPYSVRLQGWRPLARQTAPVRSAPRRVVPAGGRLSQPQRPRRRGLSVADASGSSGAQRGGGSMATGCGSTRWRATPWRCTNLPSALPGEDPDA
jgi:hypothetical protein